MKRILTFILLSVFVSATFAQKIQNVDRNENPTFVKFESKSHSVSESKALLAGLLNMTNNDAYETMKSEKDQIGYTHEKFQQYYKGIKVENGVYIVHSKNNAIESVNGEYKVVNDISVKPTISSAEAVENAKAFINAKEYMQEEKSQPELVIVADRYGKSLEGLNEMVLAYKVDVYATKPLSRDNVYVNAHTGEIVYVNATLYTAAATGSADTRYSGTKTIATDSYSGYYRLRDYTRGNGIETYNCNEGTSYTSAVDFTDANNNWTAAEYDNADKDNGALDAHWAGLVTYDYFLDKHNRNSFNGSGAAVKAYVHFDSNYDNAYWNGSVLTFGDGSSFDILTSLDVYGHEFGHAVCSYTADLAYQNESGALNEAFSDIWGCVIEYYNAPEKQTWEMGEDLGSALRSLSDPKSKGLPDTYFGDNWYPLASNPTRFNDYGGVHYNNGPYCHWFYLLCEGGSGTNDNNDSYNITAIGVDKAEKIAYRVESVYMTSSSDYDDARTYSIQAAVDLYGAGSNEEIQVTNAMYAVGVGNEYGGVTPPTGCSTTISSFPYSEGFESGTGAWSQDSNDDFDWTRDASGTPSSSTGPSSADEGSYYMYTESSSPNYPSKVAIFNSPCFDLTSESNASFNFAYHMYGTAMGTIQLQASTDGSSWTTLWTKSGNQGNSWYNETVSLSAYYGSSSVQLRYVATTSTSWTSDFAIDDISVTTGGTPPVGTDLTLTITFDNYPEETSWTLKTDGGSTVASGGTYGSQADGSTLVIPINGLDDDCYVFTMLDSYGDGICCSYGSGSYTLKVTGGATIASGGSFTSSDVTNFCIPYTSYGFAATDNAVDNVITTPAVNLYPNPASTHINVQVTNAKANGMISIYSATGALIKVVEMDENDNEVDVSELPSGLYLISVETKKEAITKQFIKK